MKTLAFCLGLALATAARADDGIRPNRFGPSPLGPNRQFPNRPPGQLPPPPPPRMAPAVSVPKAEAAPISEPPADGVVKAEAAPSSEPTAENAMAPPKAEGAPPAAPAAAPLVQAAKGNPLWAVPLASLSATRERPLFSPSRRPPETAAPPPPPRVAAAPPPPPVVAVAETPPFTLLGTVLGAGGNFAVLLNTSTNEVRRVRQGGNEAGWTAQKVDPRATVLTKDGVENTLELPKSTDAPPNVPGVPPGGDNSNTQ